MTWPIGVRNGKLSGWMTFRARISKGSRPSSAAAMSTSCSLTQMNCGMPKPRSAPPGAVLVCTMLPSTRMFGMAYGSMPTLVPMCSTWLPHTDMAPQLWTV